MSAALLAFVAALAGTAVALWTAERQHRLTNVTAERAAWRARMRELVADLIVGPAGGGDAAAARRRAAIGLRLSTNPLDAFDREIGELADRIAQADEPEEDDRRRLALRVQLLLKHDWERAKLEAGWSGSLRVRFAKVLGLEERPRRPDYARFVDWRMRNPADMDERLPPT